MTAPAGRPLAGPAPYRALVASGELVPLPGSQIDGAEVYRWDR
jgi:hypothetical protein